MSRTRKRHSGDGSDRKKKIIIAVIVVLVVAAVAFFGYNTVTKGKQAAKNTAEVQTDTVKRGDVTLTITGSAAVEPYERYEIIPKVSGDIISCNYEVGDMVEKDAVLYRFDTSSTDISMQKQRLSLEQSETNYKNALKDKTKLSITADAEGVISNLTLKVGDEIKNGAKLADISNTKILEVELPFNAAQAASIGIGDSAYVSSSVHMSNVSGTVTHKDANSHAGSDGTQLYNVTVRFENPGAFYEGMTVGGAVGDMISAGSGQIKLSDSGTAAAEAEGTITNIYYKNGDYVKKGAVIASISSDTITDSIKSSENNYENAKLSMRDAEENLEDYSLTAPISGTVITKNAKAGDTIDKTNATTTLMVIADVSKLKFDLEIDELDVSKVTTGQKVEVTCDALPDEIFEGEITNLSVEGTSSNGVTTYTAEVVIYEPGNLRPSMNIDASVVAQSSSNTLYIPSEDVKTIGNIYYVFKKSDSSDSSATKDEQKRGERPEGMTKNGEKPEGMPESMPQNGEKPEGMTGEKATRLPQAPDGFETVQITVGVVGDEFTEVLSGLEEGDEIYTQTGTSSRSTMDRMMGGSGMSAPGGMGSGGMSAPGGMGGGPR